MELITTSVSRRKKRTGKPKWVARCVYLDDEGKRREKTQEALTKADAKDLLKSLEAKFKRSEGREIEADKMTFNDLASYCEKHYFKEAEYINERKVSGLRSFVSVKAYVATLKNYFGNHKIKTIKYDHIRAYRNARLKTISKRTGKPLSMASVNRELSYLRRMLNIAKRQGWIYENPFNLGDVLIQASSEVKRERILTVAEEKRLLDACGDRISKYNRNGKDILMKDKADKREHLRLIILTALDTGMRQGEILSLTWKHIDLEQKRITLRAFHTKTATARPVPITPRLESEFIKLREKALQNLNEGETLSEQLVFGIKNNVKRSFNKARELAGLSEVRFHDLRHTAATRLVRSGIPISEAGKLLGHTQAQTTYRYINVDDDTLRRASEALTNYKDNVTDIIETEILC